ncbi:MAG TPA: DUF1302 family protein [Thermoanaerobaculia bacterium]
MRLRARSTAIAAVLLLAATSGLADYAVQVAALADPALLARAAADLREAGYPVLTEPLTTKQGQKLTRLMVGPYRDKKEAEAAAAQLAAGGWPGYVRAYRSPSVSREESPAASVSASPPAPEARAEAPPTAPAPSPAAPPPAPAEPRSSEPESAAESGQSAEAEAPSALPLAPEKTSERGVTLRGLFQSEGAYTYRSPEHWSKFRNLLEANLSGRLSENVRWTLGGRVWYDAIYSLTDFYPKSVRDDAEFVAAFRETYVDVSAGDFDLRLGRQQIVWGEVIGLFFADVVSARELREFLARDLDFIRTPQWALRLEWTKGDFHAEAIGIPYMTYDEIGVPGSDFYPYPPPVPGAVTIILGEKRPPHTLSNGAWGARLSSLVGGFDVAAFYYNSVDVSPAFSRAIEATDPAPTVIYTPEHFRIWQTGATISKDLGSVVVKGEAVYTSGRELPVTRLQEADGLVPQNTIDAIVAAEYTAPGGTRVNVQLFTRAIPSRDPDLFAMTGFDPGGSLDVATKLFADRLELEALGVTSFKDQGWMARFKARWLFGPRLRLLAGADLFGGSSVGFFGRYKNSSRYVAEARYTF